MIRQLMEEFEDIQSDKLNAFLNEEDTEEMYQNDLLRDKAVEIAEWLVSNEASLLLEED